MAKKDQERKALEQIRKIVAGLGEDSYIGMAMDGVLDDAEENINNDFALSMKYRWESEMRRCDELEKKVQRLESTISCRDVEIAEKNEKINALLGDNRRLADERDDAQIANEQNAQKLIGCQTNCNAQEQEITRLKARLFDLIDNQ